MAMGTGAGVREMLDQHSEQHEGGGFPPRGRAWITRLDDHRPETLAPTQVVDPVHTVIVRSTDRLTPPNATPKRL
ncbi:hypothetical protein GCM10022236_17170 [Microlunatus ginsengisoli]|uniref:Uncharacterized protein n=1 Tax=Microlunatus ginsengisoli TaxID=363863 RepID=A0ABP6ZPE7_9ACTN